MADDKPVAPEPNAIGKAALQKEENPKDALAGIGKQISDSFDARSKYVGRFLWAGVLVVLLSNIAAVCIFLRSLDGLLSEVQNSYQLAAVISKAVTVALFDIAGTYAGVRLISAAERLTLPVSHEPEMLRALLDSKGAKQDSLPKDMRALLLEILDAIRKS